MLCRLLCLSFLLPNDFSQIFSSNRMSLPYQASEYIFLLHLDCPVVKIDPNSILGGNIFFLWALFQMTESPSHGRTEFDSRTYNSLFFIFMGMNKKLRLAREGAQRAAHGLIARPKPKIWLIIILFTNPEWMS